MRAEGNRCCLIATFGAGCWRRTNTVDDALLPAVRGVAMRHELVDNAQALQREDDSPDAESPPTCMAHNSFLGGQRSRVRHVALEVQKGDVPHAQEQGRNLLKVAPWGDDIYEKEPGRQQGTHPAGVRGVGWRRLSSALVGPRAPSELATLTAMRTTYATALLMRRVREGRAVLISPASMSRAWVATDCCISTELEKPVRASDLEGTWIATFRTHCSCRSTGMAGGCPCPRHQPKNKADGFC